MREGGRTAGTGGRAGGGDGEVCRNIGREKGREGEM